MRLYAAVLGFFLVSAVISAQPAVPYNEGAVVKFTTPLPSLTRNAPAGTSDVVRNGSYNNEELAMPGLLTSPDTRLGEMLLRTHQAI